jgi:hypothetical protein
MSLLLLFRSSEAAPSQPEATAVGGGRFSPFEVVRRPAVIDDTDEVLALALALL